MTGRFGNVTKFLFHPTPEHPATPRRTHHRGPQDRPHLEEIAFVMAKPLGGTDVTIYDVLNTTDYVVPALEILDTRIERSDPKAGRMRTIAESAGIVTGGRPSRTTPSRT